MKNFKELDSQSPDIKVSKFVLNKLSRKALFMLLSCFLVLSQGFAINNNFDSNANDNATENETVSAQEITITGTVSDIGGPLPGVNILVKGTSNGTQTDFDGNYTISVNNSNAVLVFSYIGYKNQEVTVGNQSTVNVTLEEDIAGLDEVVVVGYTTRKRGELTGSVSTVSAKEIENTSNRDVAKSLAGRTTGLIVNDRGGYPGSNDVSILVRGVSTLGNNNPLILIDGVQSAIGTFNQLAPQDIASLSILKDGAAAIYGNRAANGVIIVTTKRGKAGKPKINFSTSYSLSSFSVKPELFNSEQYLIYENEIAERKGDPSPYSQEEIDNYAAGGDPINYPNTDWADLTFANSSPETRNSISISGGNERVNYFVSGDIMSRQGVFASGDLKFKQTQIRSNIDIKMTDDIKIGVDLSGRFANNQEPGVNASFIYKHIYTNLPTEVGRYPNGLYGWGGENGANPAVMSSNQSGFVDGHTNDLRGRLSLDWKLDDITEGLSLNAFVGVRKTTTDDKSWYTPWTIYRLDDTTGDYNPEIGFSQSGQQRILREDFFKFDETLLNATLRYNRIFGKHSINGLIGAEQQTSENRNFWAQKQNFPTPDHPFLFAGSSEGQVSNGSAAERALLSYFGNVVYDYNKKYFAELTVRRDGSSNFPSDKRFDTFYSIGGTWAIGKESFLENVEWLDALNLRSSYAVMGNDRIAPFQFLTRYSFSNTNPNNARPNYYVFGESGVTEGGFRSANVPNPLVTWETAYMNNFAVSFAMFGNRLSGDINYFNQRREDILIPRFGAVADFTGIRLPDQNAGRVDSHGLEITLGWADQINDDFSYNLGFNFTQAKNEIVKYPQPDNIAEALRLEGSPVGSYITYPTAGIFTDQAQVDATAVKLPGTVEGEPIYLDTNEDGEINNGDRIRRNTSVTPEIQYGITGGLNYKNWNFNFLLQGQAEAEVLVFFDQPGSKPQYVFDQRWTPNNRNSRYPRAFGADDGYSSNRSGDPENFEGADLWLHDASFLRLKEIELGYTLPKDVVKFADIKIFARGFNLLTMFSDVYKLGLDPEATSHNNFRGSTYPSQKMFTFGLNLTF
ncbi:TonB-dependent receptor [uncultured Algibacter sp.]|uniref:SusC/RagA family TonB-linked outer membrane protein n=1 Tax=uncultured Algibacter sp. TaxID=298659 RepID=UPI00262DE02F|nr:TonB-dependent receptor [uncultured Algibacter sp.]